MARLNVAVATEPIYTHEGAKAARITPLAELRRSVMTCMLWEDGFYEKGSVIAARIAELISQVEPAAVADLAIEARERMKLRHAPLFIARELARRKGAGSLVQNVLSRIIKRADEPGELLAMYGLTGVRKEKRPPIAKSIQRGLAKAITRFDAYQLAKYNRDAAIKLRDVLFLTHAKPKNQEQAEVWKKLVDGKLESPDTWEVALSAGADKKATFERLIRERMLGGMALLRNLRNMVTAGVDESLIRDALDRGVPNALPFRFVTAARYAPRMEASLEVAMLKAIEGAESLPGRTGLLVDVSGSMDEKLSAKSETTRLDAACGLAILLRQVATAEIATFSTSVAIIPPRRGFALRDSIIQSQPHSSTMLKGALSALQTTPGSGWQGLDRIIVITDEQSQDGILPAFAPKAYLINVASNKNGVGYGNGWTHIDGWSERVVDYIAEHERSELNR